MLLAVSSFHLIAAAELWVGFGTGKKFRYIPIHEIVETLGPQKCRSMAIFHAFTGCDTVSSFGGRGKKTAWDTWMSFPAVTEAFMDLTKTSPDISKRTLDLLERYVILLYDRTSKLLKVF